jgi:hypothetical protein
MKILTIRLKCNDGSSKSKKSSKKENEELSDEEKKKAQSLALSERKLKVKEDDK